MIETVYIMVLVKVETSLEHISDTVNELENQTSLTIANTKNVQVLESEILMTRVRRSKK